MPKRKVRKSPKPAQNPFDVKRLVQGAGLLFIVLALYSFMQHQSESTELLWGVLFGLLLLASPYLWPLKLKVSTKKVARR